MARSTKEKITWVVLSSFWATLTEELTVGHLDLISSILSTAGGPSTFVLLWILIGIAIGIPLFATVKIVGLYLNRQKQKADNIIYFIKELIDWSNPDQKDSVPVPPPPELRRLRASKMYDYLKMERIVPGDMRVDFKNSGDIALYRHLLDIIATIEVTGRGAHNKMKIIEGLKVVPEKASTRG